MSDGVENRTVEFTKEAVKEYLDKCIRYCRMKRDGGDEKYIYYVDAYQSMRTSLFDELLPKERKLTEQDWKQAKENFDYILGKYKEYIGEPAVNVTFAITTIFDPLLKRYNSGERSQELYDAMMDVR